MVRSNMFLFLIIALLAGCNSSDQLYDEKTLKEMAEDNIKNGRYKLAGEKYFNLWCQYPNSNQSALLDAAQSYYKTGDYAKALELLDDYSVIRGDADGQIYKWKALVYIAMVKSPLKNLDKAEKALINLQMYRKLKPEATDLKDEEEFLKSIIVSAKMLDADLARRANPPSFIYALKVAGEVVENYSDSPYVDYSNKIYENCLSNLGVATNE